VYLNNILHLSGHYSLGAPQKGIEPAQTLGKHGTKNIGFRVKAKYFFLNQKDKS
jgi:hypothetical protein